VGCGGSRYVSTTLVNRAPNADNESISVEEGKSASVNVLSGDTDPDGHALSIAGYTNGNKGTVTCSGSSCTYTSTTTITANTTDSFTYTVSDGYGGQDVGTVSVSIINLTPTAAKPVISPTGRTFSGTQSISISTSTSGAAIYYTLDGSTPNASSTPYTGSFDITYDATIKAFAAKSGYLNSAIDTEIFTRNRGVAVTYTYKYDALGRLIKVIEPVNGDRQYDYDDAGNRKVVRKEP
jgi:YD repeat-containing protein